MKFSYSIILLIVFCQLFYSCKERQVGSNQIISEELLNNLIDSNYVKINDYNGLGFEKNELNNLKVLKSKTENLLSSRDNINNDSILTYVQFIKKINFKKGMNDQLTKLIDAKTIEEKRILIKLIEYMIQEQIREDILFTYFDFDCMYPYSVPLKSEVSIGDTFKTEIRMGAYNIVCKAKAVINGDTLIQNEEGSFLFKEKTIKRGENIINGKLLLKEDGKIMPFDFKIKYTVK